MRRHPAAAPVLLAVLAFSGCEGGKSAEGRKSAPPASVARTIDEESLATITLTPQAEERLGIRTGAVEYRKVERSRIVGGEVVVPPGRAVIVSAPVAGILRAPPEGAFPAPGASLRKRQPVASLVPLVTPEERLRLAEARLHAEGQKEEATVRLEAATVRLERSEKLLKDQAGSARALDDARADVGLARTAVKAAEARAVLLENLGQDPEGGVTPLSIESPDEGLLRSIQVLPGQMVGAGAVLFEVLNLEHLWIRVPVHVGDLPQLAEGADARLEELDQASKASAPAVRLRPVRAPPSADPRSATVDLFFEPEEKSSRSLLLRPGQRVAVRLFFRGEEESLVAPWAAVVHDAQGGAWVYQRAAPRVYVRRRVDLHRVDGPLAVLRRGPEPGSKVVTDGAAELFGTEAGFGDSGKTPPKPPPKANEN